MDTAFMGALGRHSITTVSHGYANTDRTAPLHKTRSSAPKATPSGRKLSPGRYVPAFTVSALSYGSPRGRQILSRIKAEWVPEADGGELPVFARSDRFGDLAVGFDSHPACECDKVLVDGPRVLWSSVPDGHAVLSIMKDVAGRRREHLA